MPRPPRAAAAGGLYQALKRGNSRAQIFHKEAAYEAFERILAEGWHWGSLWRWRQPAKPTPAWLSAWPMPRLPNWVEKVNEPLTERELAAV